MLQPMFVRDLMASVVQDDQTMIMNLPLSRRSFIMGGIHKH
jgi:hypothetical protein